MIRRTFPRNPLKREKATHFVFRSVQNVDWIVDSAPLELLAAVPWETPAAAELSCPDLTNS